MKIVVCVDETESSKLALDKAVDFANNVGNVKIILVNSLNTEVNHKEDVIIQESTEDAIERCRDLINNLKTRAIEKSKSDLDIETVVLDNNNSNSVQTIIDYISNKNIYQVFIGHRAMDEKHEKLYGSFAKEMISNSPVPVVVTTSKNTN